MRFVLPLLLFLGACVSVLPEPEVPRGLYQIQPAGERIALSHNVTIREFEAPQLMAGEAMVAEGEDGALRLVRGAEWSGRLTRQMQLALIDSFAPDSDGSALLPELGVDAPYRAVGRVQRLLLSGEQAFCDASVTLMNRSTRRLLAQLDVSAEKTASSKRTGDRAIALSEAAQACVSQMAQFISDSVAEAADDAG